MIFDIYAFGDVLLSIIPLIFVTAILFSVLNKIAMQHSSLGIQIAIAVNYITCIGVIMHEVAHQIICKLFGVQIKEAHYFYVDHRRTEEEESVSIGGKLLLGDCNSPMAGLLLTTAPLFLNGTLIALLLYHAPLLEGTIWNYLAIYLGISLLLHAKPSAGDMKFLAMTFKANPGRGVLEILLFCTLIGVFCWIGIIYQPDLWALMVMIVSFLIIVVFIGRWKSSPHSNHYIPRT